MPLDIVASILQGYDKDVGVVVSSQHMLVRVYDRVRVQLLTDLIKVVFREPLFADDVVDRVECAVSGQGALSLEVWQC